jgi:hypothetical protein
METRFGRAHVLFSSWTLYNVVAVVIIVRVSLNVITHRRDEGSLANNLYSNQGGTDGRMYHVVTSAHTAGLRKNPHCKHRI